MPLLMGELCGYLRAQGIDPEVQIIFDGRPWQDVPMPDLAIQLNPRGGPGFQDERALDRQSVQIETRGRQDDPTSAEELAWQIDEILCAPVPPLEIGPSPSGVSTTVRMVDRKAPPTLALWDPAKRSYFVATYVFTVPSYGP